MKIKNQRRSFAITFLSILLSVSIVIFSCTKNDQLSSLENPTEEIAVGIEKETGANTYHSQQTWLLDETQWVPCANDGNGEYVKLYGYVHFTNANVVNNNHYSLVTHTNPNQVGGTGLTTGDKYVASGGGHQVYSGSFINGQSTAKGSTIFRFTGAGPGNNLTIEFIAHVMVNASGEVSNQLLEIKNSCQ